MQTTFRDKRIKPCPICGGKAVLETWASGGRIFAVRCDNPDRPNKCDDGFYLSRSKSPEEAIEKWNRFGRCV